MARIDSGFASGNLVEPYYDPMLAKVIGTGTDREHARQNLIAILKEVRISGVLTNRDFLIGLLRSAEFEENIIHTRLVDEQLDSLLESLQRERDVLEIHSLLAAAAVIALQTPPDHKRNRIDPWDAIGHWRLLPEITLEIDHRTFRIRYELRKGRTSMKFHFQDRPLNVSLERKEGNNYWIRIGLQVMKLWGTTDRSEILLDLDGQLLRFRRLDILDRRYIRSSGKANGGESKEIIAPLNGRIVQINVKEGESVEEGDPLMVIESMKMENKILASRSAVIRKIEVNVGDQVQANQLMITLDKT
jgi:acetyl/propionyl-CoA carboxylase alpha subunit